MAIDIQLLHTPLSLQHCQDWVAGATCGGIVHFVGTVREQTGGRPVSRLDFEAYEPMAVSEMRKIAQTVKERWPAERVAIHHRVGKLEIGEIAVIIAVATPHRVDAFAACQFAIDTLKQTVPIWKKEIFTDGEVWVAAHP
ncbi:MAG: molybdenum cofactor biosynthesis protein MoaE [Bacteroidota bacterium]